MEHKILNGGFFFQETVHSYMVKIDFFFEVNFIVYFPRTCDLSMHFSAPYKCLPKAAVLEA